MLLLKRLRRFGGLASIVVSVFAIAIVPCACDETGVELAATF
jgi:hypothetical protein